MKTKPRVKWMRTLGNASYMLGVALLITAMAYTAAPATRVAAKDPAPTTNTINTVLTCNGANTIVFAVGQTVRVQGKHFAASTGYSGTITGSGGSCDAAVEVASFSGTTDSLGRFCNAAYVVAADDCGEYEVSVSQSPNQLSALRYRVKVPPATATASAPSLLSADSAAADSAAVNAPSASSGSQAAALIPVAGAALGGSWRSSTILFNLGIGFLGLGLVVNGVARSRKDMDL